MIAASTTAAGEADVSARGYPPPRIAWRAVVVFFLLYNLSYLDRAMLNLLVGPIKQTLGIGDFQISLLQGLAFAIFYTIFGIPIGWFVDRRPRRHVIAVGVVIWSVAASACGLAVRFWQLLLGRIGVAAGEATLAPAAYSYMSDIFPRERLALPMSMMGAGAALGGALAGLLAGHILPLVPAGGIELPLIGHVVGWQVALLATGIPGILLAPLIYTIPEPQRRSVPLADASASDTGPFRHVRRHARLYSGHFLGFGLYSMVNYGVSAWLPTFFMRRHGWDITTAGWAIAMLTLFAGLPGSMVMGLIVDRWFARGRTDAHLRFMAIAAFLQLGSVLAAVSVSDGRIAVALFVLQTALAGFTGVGAAALQIVTPAQMRGQISAMYLLVFNLIGLGFGPTVVAAFTDFVFHDEQRVGSSLVLTFAIFAPLAALCFLIAAPAMRRCVAARDGGTR